MAIQTCIDPHIDIDIDMGAEEWALKISGHRGTDICVDVVDITGA